MGDLHHLRLLEATGGDGGSTHPDAAGDKGLLRVVGNGVFVDGDLNLVQSPLKLLAGDVEIPHVYKAEVVVRAAGDETEPFFYQFLRQDLGVFHDLLRVSLEFRLQRLPKADGLGGDDVLQRAALSAGEHGGIDLLVDGLIVAEDQAAPGTAKGLVGSGGHHVRIGNRGGVKPSRHQTGDVGHVHHEISAHGIGHLPELGEVDDPGIGGGTGNDDLGLAGLGGLQQRVIVDGLILAQTVGHDMEILAGDIDGAAVAQVAAVGQIHAQNGVPRLRQCEEGRQIGVSTGVGLNIGILAAE